jgi:single-strand DNA-binding protein
MSNDLNRAEFIGRLGSDPEIRYTPTGTAVANLSIACGQSWKSKDTGEKQEKTEWVRLVAFGKLAEIISEYCRKGKQIYASGKLQTRKYTDKNGVEKYSTEVVLDTMQLLGSKDDGSGDAKEKSEPSEHAARPTAAKGQGDFDDSIPF